MIRIQKNCRGQVISVEYVVIFALVLSVMAGMTIYFKRLLQARIRDAGYGMADIVQARTAGYGVNVIYRQYEPYYQNATTLSSRDEYSKTRIVPSLTTGIFRKQVDETSTVETFSATAPPKDASCAQCL